MEDVDDLLEIADVKSRKGKLDMSEVTITVLQVLAALSTSACFGRCSKTRVERAIVSDSPFRSGCGADIVDVAVRNFDNRLLDYVLVGPGIVSQALVRPFLEPYKMPN